MKALLLPLYDGFESAAAHLVGYVARLIPIKRVEQVTDQLCRLVHGEPSVLSDRQQLRDLYVTGAVRVVDLEEQLCLVGTRATSCPGQPGTAQGKLAVVDGPAAVGVKRVKEPVENRPVTDVELRGERRLSARRPTRQRLRAAAGLPPREDSSEEKLGETLCLCVP